MAPPVKQRLATHVPGPSGEPGPGGCGGGGIPSWPLRCEIKYQTRSQTCVRLCVGGRGAGGAWQAIPRVLPCTSEPEKGKAEGLKVCKLQNVLFTTEVVSGELELGAKSLLLHIGCTTDLGPRLLVEPHFFSSAKWVSFFPYLGAVVRAKWAIHVNGKWQKKLNSDSTALRKKREESCDRTGFRVSNDVNGLVFPPLGPLSFLASSMQASPSRGPGSSRAPVESNGLRLGGMESHGNIKLLAPSRRNGRLP